MRTALLAVALSIAACSSSPEAEPAPAAVDSGSPVDARVACGLPGEAVECLCATGPGLGRCNADGRVDPCVCLGGDAGPVVTDARGDVAESSPEAAVDVGPDVAALDPREEIERALCLAGVPRLTWSADGCVDTKWAGEFTKAEPCRFRVAGDGTTRCLPRGSAAIVGYGDNTCVNGSLDWSSEPVPAYLRVGGDVVETRRGSRSSPWYLKVGSSCVEQAGVLPGGLPKKPSGDYGDAVYANKKIADSEFYAATF